MRVIAGSAKGRRLTAPRGSRVRPTSDRVKEALFSSLQPMLAGARVLDLYAGSGALGIEALSRGAAHVVFVDRWAGARAAIEENLQATDFASRATVVGSDVADAIDAQPGPFDLVLCDPPYDIADATLTDVLARLPGRLAPAAVVVVERATRAGDVAWPVGLQPDRTRRYGGTTLDVATVPVDAPEEDGQ